MQEYKPTEEIVNVVNIINPPSYFTWYAFINDKGKPEMSHGTLLNEEGDDICNIRNTHTKKVVKVKQDMCSDMAGVMKICQELEKKV